MAQLSNENWRALSASLRTLRVTHTKRSPDVGGYSIASLLVKPLGPSASLWNVTVQPSLWRLMSCSSRGGAQPANSTGEKRAKRRGALYTGAPTPRTRDTNGGHEAPRPDPPLVGCPAGGRRQSSVRRFVLRHDDAATAIHVGRLVDRA